MAKGPIAYALWRPLLIKRRIVLRKKNDAENTMEFSELIDWTFKMAVFFLVWRAILQDRFEAQRSPKILPLNPEIQKGQSE